jgi:oxygen-dependent protoporphyrinogen oxidase
MMEPFVKKQIPSPSDESVGSFVKRRLGNEALTWLAQPLLAGIYGANPENLSLRATFPRFLEMEAKSGGVVRGMRSRRTGARKASGARYGLFASLKNGIQTLVDSLDFHLREKGVAIRKNAVVAELRKNPSRWGICLEGGEVLEADAVCLALPAYVMASLLRTHDKELADLLDDIPYGSSATINLAFRRNDISHPLDGFGFVVPDAEKRFLQAATFSHQKFAGRAPEGFVLIRGFVGGVSGGHFLKGDDATLERRTLQDLHAFLGLRDSPLFSLIERHARSLPQYTVGHMDRLAQIEKRYAVLLSSLALAGNWGRGVGIPDCIESGDRAGNRLLEVLGG